MSTTATPAPSKQQRFSVLYYKRTNKVHKNRGTTREDGILTIASPPSCTVTLVSGSSLDDVSTNNNSMMEDDDEEDDRGGGKYGGKKTKKQKWNQVRKSIAAGTHRSKSGVIWSGVNTALAKKTFDLNPTEGGWKEDDVLVLSGQWECQIVSSLGIGGAKENPVAVKSNMTSSTMRKLPLTSSSQKRVPLLPLKKYADAKPIQSRRILPLQSKSSIKLGLASGSKVGTKRPLLPRALPQAPSEPTASSKKMKKDKNGEWFLEKTESESDDDSEDEGGATTSATSMTSSIPKSLLRSSSSKRPLMVAARPTSSIVKSNNINANPNSSDFPGALGDKINVPASVRDVLRPHQREGIAFLWNCVTGVSPLLKDAMKKSMQNENIDSDDDGEGGDLPLGSKMVKAVNNSPRGAVLADEMGLGKTLMTIATIFAFHRRQRDRRFIVVCPSSLVSNWAKEFDKWLGKASQPKRVVVRSGGEEGLRHLKSFGPLKPQLSEVLILSYELFRLHSKLIAKASKIGLLVVDEGHRLKNTAGSQTLSALNSVEAEARILISGTPIQNNLSEFYNVANFAVPGILGSLNTFRRLYERPMNAANQKNASQKQKEKGRIQSKSLDAITSTFVLRRLQKDVLKSILPPRTEVLLFCRPSEEQCRLYRDISDRASRSIGSIGGIDDSNNPLMLLTEVRKLCTHPSLLTKDGDSEAASDASLSGKLEVLRSLLESIRKHNPTDKVVIISNFTSALAVIEGSILRKSSLPFVRLDGSTDLASRQPLVDSFNNSSVDHSFAFLLSSKAGGCGLNLIGANRLIMVDADWNPATDHQAMARVYRQGQKKPCYIYRMFTTGTVEEVIFQRQTQKGNLAKLANDGGSRSKSQGKNGASFSKEELRDCFTLKEECKCDTKRKLGNKWPDYVGASSLESRGFEDGPLLDVCDGQSTTLSFVHVVDDESTTKSVNEEISSDNESEQSFQDGDESSSEEEEFEG